MSVDNFFTFHYFDIIFDEYSFARFFVILKGRLKVLI